MVTVKELFKEKHPRIYARIIECIKEQGKDVERRVDTFLSKAFTWDETVEREDFWSKINNDLTEEYKIFYEKYPEIEKWSVGSYIIILRKNSGMLLNTNTIAKIVEETTKCVSVIDDYSNGDMLSKAREEENSIKWFATKEEAEEFAITLFNKPEKFVFPEKWAIDTRNPNVKKIVGAWLDIETHSSCYLDTPFDYYHYPDFERSRIYNIIQPGYTEITLEQWKQYYGYKEPKQISTKEEKSEKKYACEINDSNVEVISKWIKSRPDWSPHSEIQGYVLSDRGINGSYMYWSNISNKPEYKVISFEEFRKLVIKDEIMENKPNFEVGQWYKWYQENHKNYHYGKFSRYDENSFLMKPWIINCSLFDYSGSFESKYTQQIEKISLEEIQKYLPDGHPDKIQTNVTTEKFKVGDWVFTDMYNTIGSKEECVQITKVDEQSQNQPHFKVRKKDGSEIWCYPSSTNNSFVKKALLHEVLNTESKTLTIKEEAEKALQHLKNLGFKKGCTYITLNGYECVATRDLEIYGENSQNCYIDCGPGFLWEYDKKDKFATLVETNNKPEINTYGLKIGDELPQDIINAWISKDKNEYVTYWKYAVVDFSGDRIIEGFKVLDGEVGFLVSNTVDVYLKAKGFKEFADNFYNKSELKEEKLNNNQKSNNQNLEYQTAVILKNKNKKSKKQLFIINN